MTVSARILIFGHDSMLLKTRCLILKRAGFQVRTSTALEGASKILVNEEIDLFILCRSVSRAELKYALSVAHEILPEMKNLILSDDLPTTFCTSRDTLVNCFLDPEALVSVATRLTSPKSMSGTDVLPLTGEHAPMT
jgi:hypothetical protein